MAEELGKRYIAFSEDALSEQILKLTDIVNQQANAIQNLSASIVQLSSGMAGGVLPSTSAHRVTNGIAAASVTPVRHRLAVPRPAAVAPVARLPTFTPKRLKPELINGHASKSSIPKKLKTESHQPTTSSSLPVEEDAQSGSLEDETVVQAGMGQPVDQDKAQDAKNSLLTQLVALRDTCPFDQRISVVRARLCSDWIAIRPEELLARLRTVGMEGVTNRKEFMENVMNIGPGIVRGRSVKFGRDTRRALAIPRMHFSPDELAIIDNSFLREHGARAGQLHDEAAEDDDEDLHD